MRRVIYGGTACWWKRPWHLLEGRVTGCPCTGRAWTPPPPRGGGVHALSVHGTLQDWLGVSHPSLLWAFPLLQMAAIMHLRCWRLRPWHVTSVHASLPHAVVPSPVTLTKNAPGVRPASLGGGCCGLVCWCDIGQSAVSDSPRVCQEWPRDPMWLPRPPSTVVDNVVKLMTM